MTEFSKVSPSALPFRSGNDIISFSNSQQEGTHGQEDA